VAQLLADNIQTEIKLQLLRKPTWCSRHVKVLLITSWMAP